MYDTVQRTVTHMDTVLPFEANNDIRHAAQTAAAIATLAMVDIAMQARNELEAATYISETDHFTGLANRRGFERTLTRQIYETTTADQSLCMIMMDLNNIDEVNEAVGRHEGDRWVKETAGILQRYCDIRPTRWRGDEFVALFAGHDRTSIENVWNDMSNEFINANIQLGAGAVFYDTELHCDTEQFMHQADQAMYEGKRTSKLLARPMLHIQ